MNLNDLNQKLFSALEALESGEMEPKQAQAIVNVNNAINSNCKLILEASKLSENPNVLSLVASEEKIKQLKDTSTYNKKMEFSLSIGYKSVAEAIGELGKNNFELRFRNFCNQ